jgi:hypothetical protein
MILGVTWGVQQGWANGPPIFFLPKKNFFASELKGKELFSKRSFWWCKERRNEKPAFEQLFPSFIT